MGADPGQSLSEMASAKNDPAALQRLQLTIFARTLNDLLLVKRFSNNRRLPHPLIWIDNNNPKHQQTLAKMQPETWDK